MLKMFIGQANEDLGLGGAGRTVQRQLVGEGDARLAAGVLPPSLRIRSAKMRAAST